MKLQMEFEAEDFWDMVQSYFKSKNFVVENLHDLCEDFEKVFPNGLKVQVRVATPAVRTAVPAPEPAVGLVEDEAPTPVVPVVIPATKGTPRLSADDLMDPTGERQAPSRDELLKEDQSAYDAQEVNALVAESQRLQEEDGSHV